MRLDSRSISCSGHHTDATSPNEHATQLQTTLQEAFERVRTNLATAHNRQKMYYNKHIHGKPIQPGDHVWLLTTAVPPGQSRKFRLGHTRFYKKILTALTYRIQRCNDQKRIQTVHFNQLKPCPPDMRRADVDTPRQNNDQRVGYNLLINTSDDEAPTEDRLAPPTPPPARRYPSRNRHPPDRLGTLY